MLRSYMTSTPGACGMRGSGTLPAAPRSPLQVTIAAPLLD